MKWLSIHSDNHFIYMIWHNIIYQCTNNLLHKYNSFISGWWRIT